MTWEKTREDRERDKRTYGDPQYQANRKLALKRAGGACEMLLEGGRRCGSRERVQVDHIVNLAAGGTHHLDNLRVLCKRCHERKTAQEGKGYRRHGVRRRKPQDPPLAARTRW